MTHNKDKLSVSKHLSKKGLDVLLVLGADLLASGLLGLDACLLAAALLLLLLLQLALSRLDETSLHALDEDVAATLGDSTRVELREGAEVAERIATDIAVLAVVGGLDDSLDSLAVHDASKVGVGHLGTRELEALARSLVGAVDLVEGLKGIGSPDDEAADVGTRSKLEDAETSDLAEIDARDVAESVGETALVVVVDHKRTTTHGVTTVAQLALAGTELAGLCSTLDIVVGTDGLETGDCVLGLLDLGCRLGRKNKRDLRDLLDAVAASHHKSRDGRGSDGADDRIAAHVHVHATVPATVGGLGAVHVATTGHVTEGSLTRAVRATTVHTGNTGNSTARVPGLSRVHDTHKRADAVGLTTVLRHVAVDNGNDICADGCSEDVGKSNRLLGLLASQSIKLSNNRTSSRHSLKTCLGEGVKNPISLLFGK